jgi:hypothetical protein
MTIFQCLEKAVSFIKKDIIFLGPFLVFTLLNSVVSRFVFHDIEKIITLRWFFILISQHTVQTLVGFFVIMMVLNFKKDEVYIPLIISLYLKRFKVFLGASLLINIPFSLLVFFGASLAQGAEGASSMLIILFLVSGIYLMVPFTAFTYFVAIRVCSIRQPVVSVFKEMGFFCLKQYRLCLKWFWVMISLNFLQVFILPLSGTDFILKDVILAVIQAIVLTVTMIFSVMYYQSDIAPHFRKRSNTNEVIFPIQDDEIEGNDS